MLFNITGTGDIAAKKLYEKLLDQINLKKSVLQTWVMDIEFAHLKTCL